MWNKDDKDKILKLKADLAKEIEKKERLENLIRRTVCTLQLNTRFLVGVPYGPYESVLRKYLDSLDMEIKEKTERQKIEKIILDLKNRKWEPEE